MKLRLAWILVLLVGAGAVRACQRGPDIDSQEGALHVAAR